MAAKRKMRKRSTTKTRLDAFLVRHARVVKRITRANGHPESKKVGQMREDLEYTTGLYRKALTELANH